MLAIDAPASLSVVRREEIEARGADNVLEAGLYRAMARCAKRIVVVTDSGKIGLDKVQTTLAFSDIHIFVTDSGAPANFVAALREHGCEVIVVARPKQDRGRQLRESQGRSRTT